MLTLHLVSLALALVLPIALFIAIYLVAYLAWHVINATFTVMLGRDVSTKVAGRVTVKHGKLGLALYILFWLVMIGISGAAWMFLDWASFPLPVQMPLLAIPLFAMVIPVAGLVIKPRSGYRSPVTMFVLVLFMMVMYTWVRYITWDPAAGPRIFSIPDAIIDVVLVTYTFFVITKNSDKISSALRGKVSPRQLFMLVAWCRVSSMILLVAVGDYQLAGLDAREGTYLLGMLFIFILGTIHALAWARQGVVATRGTMTMPDLAGQFHR